MTSREKQPSHRLFATVYDPVMWGLEQTILPEHRKYLARNLSGAVLDLGTGTGAMLPYFKTGADDIEYHGIEPDPYMRRQAEEKAEKFDVDISIQEAGAEALPYSDDKFDVVIASMVFCTIPDVDAALDEVTRVLEPGGEFRFFEHVHSDNSLGRIQDLANPVWRKLAGGCHLNRDTSSAIANHPEFETVEIRQMDMGIGLVRPFIRGTVKKPLE